jgi:hypothetical protein
MIALVNVAFYFQRHFFSDARAGHDRATIEPATIEPALTSLDRG